MVYTCEICGKQYEHTPKWKSRNVCCEACYKKRKAIKTKEYYRARMAALKAFTEEDKKNSERQSRKKEEKKDKIVEINTLARQQHLTYGQLQGLKYLEIHPNITRRKA